MRFMNLIKSTENADSPPRALLDAIAKFGQEAIETGWIVSAGGLLPSAMRSGWSFDWETHYLRRAFHRIQGVDRRLAIYKVASKQEAVERASQFLQLYKEHWPAWEGEVEVRQMFDSLPEGKSA